MRKSAHSILIWLCCAGAFASIPNGISRSGTLTVSGATPAPATNVTVNGAAAQRYGDLTFAATNFMLSNGTNTFTILATNVYGLAITNVLSVNLPSNVALASDTNGNLTGDGTRAFYYDAENRLTNVNVAGTWKTEFGYDGFGRRRIERDYTWNGSTWSQTNETHFVFDGLVPIQEHDSNNAVLVTYTRGLDFSGGINGAGGIGGLLARSDSAQLTVWHGTNSGAHTYYHKDGNGNVTALMNAQNLVVARYIYDAFGNLLGRSGPMADVNLYRFSSKEYHPNSDLIYFGFRFYDANLQRWINRDPIGEAGGLNLYGFVRNSPANLVDRFGLRDIYTLGPENGSAPAGNFVLESARDQFTPGFSGDPIADRLRQQQYEQSLNTSLYFEPLSADFGPWMTEAEANVFMDTFLHLPFVNILTAATEWITGQNILDPQTALNPWEGPNNMYNAVTDTALAAGAMMYGIGESAISSSSKPFMACPESAAEGTTMRNVAQFEGMEVRAVRDLSHVEQGTLEAMQQHGFAPTTVNGDSIVLHHLGQNPAGPLVEMPAGNHSIWNSVQHPFGNTAGAGLTEAERAAYNAWRTDYWKWRATQELNTRRVLGN